VVCFSFAGGNLFLFACIDW